MATPESGEQDNDNSKTDNVVSGDVHGVVQAGTLHGGVHFHGTDRPAEPIPRQLPGGVRGFVNRAAELARLDEILANGDPEAIKVLIIAGTAGVGKTSLALHWAHRVRHDFPDGQFYVNLRGYDPGAPVNPEQVLDDFLRALGVRPMAIPVELEARAGLYRSLLANRRVLTVLDNAATVRQVRPLLPGTAGCLVVVTSRRRLSGLVVRDSARRLTLDVLPEVDAVDLLRSVVTDYRLPDDPEKLVELARLCARLPLALRIAAERAASRPLMPLDELIGDLRDESGLWDALTTEDGDEADAVRSVFAWSYRALPVEAARLFRLLGLHVGPEFSASAAAAVAETDITTVRHLLDILVGAHLLEQKVAGRYQFHDLLRAYASDQVNAEENPETRHAVLQRMLTWYLHTADAALRSVRPSDRRIVLEPIPAGVVPLTFASRRDAISWYEMESGNLVAATKVAADSDLDGIAWQIPAVLRPFYTIRNEFENWIATGLVGLNAAGRVGDRNGEAEILESLGKAHFQMRRLVEAEHYHRLALLARRETGDRFGEAVSINALGLLNLRYRRLAEAETHFERSMTIFREQADRRWEMVSRSNLGETYYELGRLRTAADALTAAIAVCRELGDRVAEGNDLFFLSMTQREMGRIDEALSSIQAALAIADEMSSLPLMAHWLVELARVQRHGDDPALALVACQRAASIQRRLGDRSREAMALGGAGEAYQQLGRFEEAVEFHRMAVAAHRELGDHWQLGIELDNLATALSRAGEPGEAHGHWEEALRVLAVFDDPRAVRLRDRVAMNSLTQ
jgi:tetratricopeptide (TPR) repeat protein